MRNQCCGTIAAQCHAYPGADADLMWIRNDEGCGVSSQSRCVQTVSAQCHEFSGADADLMWIRTDEGCAVPGQCVFCWTIDVKCDGETAYIKIIFLRRVYPWKIRIKVLGVGHEWHVRYRSRIFCTMILWGFLLPYVYVTYRQ